MNLIILIIIIAVIFHIGIDSILETIGKWINNKDK